MSRSTCRLRYRERKTGCRSSCTIAIWHPPASQKKHKMNMSVVPILPKPTNERALNKYGRTGGQAGDVILLIANLLLLLHTSPSFLLMFCCACAYLRGVTQSPLPPFLTFCSFLPSSHLVVRYVLRSLPQREAADPDRQTDRQETGEIGRGR